MAKNRRGGYRQPNKPAAVATPQGGQRTDGGPGSKKQPLRRLPDAEYGANKAFVQQQQGAALQPAQPLVPRDTLASVRSAMSEPWQNRPAEWPPETAAVRSPPEHCR